MRTHVLKYHRQFDVPRNPWLRRRCFGFIKSDYFPSAFNKNQCWALTHKLETAFAGDRGWDCGSGTGWNCSQIGNRRPRDKGGETEGGRERQSRKEMQS